MVDQHAALNGDHTATFPESLVEQIVKCGSPAGRNGFDPFLGTGTTWVVCERLGRKCIGFEINEGYFNFKRAKDLGRQKASSNG